jgi:hypothetical protein
MPIGAYMAENECLRRGLLVEMNCSIVLALLVHRQCSRAKVQSNFSPHLMREPSRNLGVPVGAGTDATRVSSYNPYLSLYWLITGKTVGGLSLYPQENRLDRAEALKLYTMGSSWFSTEDGKKGALAPGQLADLAILSADYFSIPSEEIKQLESVLTIVGGKIVYAAEEFSQLAPPALPVSPSWSPVKEYGGYAKGQPQVVGASHSASCSHIEASAPGRTKSHLQVLGDLGLWGLGCDCFAF